MTSTGEISEKLYVNLTEEEKRELRVEAAKRGISMSELARKTLRDTVLAGEDDQPTAD